MSAQGKLQEYLVVAEELRSLVKDARDKVLLQVQGKHLSWRDRVLIGFGVKMSSTFESLIEDVGKGRPEAIHHLKTLTESFIYIRWIGQDTGDIRARLVVAEGYDQKVKFFKGNAEYPDQKQYLDSWEKARGSMILGIEDKWGKYPGIEEKAKEGGARSVYQRIYRLACEPAHVADLQEYMPLPDGTVSPQQNQVLTLWPHMAIEYGLWIMTDLLAEASEVYGLALEDKIGELRGRIEDLRRSPLN